MEFGAYGREAKEIAKRSEEIVRRFVDGNDLRSDIVRRCIIATGDPSFKDEVQFVGEIEKGVDALRKGAKVIVDVSMVKVGLRYWNVLCAIEHADIESEVRVVDGLRNLKEEMDGNIVAIGNSPAGALEVYRICTEEDVRPALIVATPVGFVNAKEAKEKIRELDVPSITTKSERGGSTVCVAIMNRLMEEARPDRGKGVVIVGVGCCPGHMTERAMEELKRAEVVFGSRRALEIAKGYIRGEVVELKRFDEETMREIEELGKRKRVAVLSTGDPMVVGLGKRLRGDVVPGISSVQLALARLGLDLSEVIVFDCHGRNRDVEMLPGRKLLILADRSFDVKRFEKYVVLENLGYENERICENCEIKSNLVIVVVG